MGHSDRKLENQIAESNLENDLKWWWSPHGVGDIHQGKLQAWSRSDLRERLFVLMPSRDLNVRHDFCTIMDLNPCQI